MRGCVMRAPTQLAFDFSCKRENEKAEFSHENIIAVLHVIAGPIHRINSLFRGRLTDSTAKEILDFLPTQEAKLAFAAAVLLEFGRPVGADFAEFAAGVQEIIRRELAAGRVRAAGKRRSRRSKVESRRGEPT